MRNALSQAKPWADYKEGLAGNGKKVNSKAKAFIL